MVILDSKHRQIIEHLKMPVIPFGGKKVYDVGVLIEFMQDIERRYALEVMGYLEQVASRPGQGVVSMFSMGDGFGLVRGIVASHGIPVTYVLPQAWKKVLLAGTPKGDKMASVVVACRLFPGCEHILRKPRGGYDHNIADALLIAEYGRIRDDQLSTRLPG